MTKYAVSILILGRPVMCDTIEAKDAAEARSIWEAQFWSSGDELRAEIPTMDDLNRDAAERMLAMMDRTREEARKFGITVEARKSRAKAA